LSMNSPADSVSESWLLVQTIWTRTKMA